MTCVAQAASTKIMEETYSLYASGARCLAGLLHQELDALGAQDIREERAGVAFSGTLQTAYRVCLWSRLASRVLLDLQHFIAADPDALYAGIQQLDWTEHFALEHSFAIDFTQRHSPFGHSHFATLRVKDAIVDQFRDKFDARPRVDVQRGDFRLHVHAEGTSISVAIDLSGDSLHRRAYRLDAGPAPLKESLAAALLLRMGWPRMAQSGAPLLDPMCGSGTLVIEAAMMATDLAPGLLHKRFGFSHWKGHRPELWQQLKREARERHEAAQLRSRLIGSDVEGRAIEAARANARRAGVEQWTRFYQLDFRRTAPLVEGHRAGLVISNPPYGQRLGAEINLHGLYRAFGETLRAHFPGWKVGVLSSDGDLIGSLGLRSRRRSAFMNGPIDCELCEFDILAKRDRQQRQQVHETQQRERLDEALQSPFANRLRKNLRRLDPWAKKQKIDAYRIYDADVPEFAIAVDRLADYLLVTVDKAPENVDPGLAKQRVDLALIALQNICKTPREKIIVRQRQRQQGRAQYQAQDDEAQRLQVHEAGRKYQLQLGVYHDTGLFLDGRILRQQIFTRAKDKRFLNLFAYTGAATVAAVAGGARRSLTIDLSQIYLDWARDNLQINGLRSPAHRFLRADCLQWLQQAEDPFDLIYLDPPTFSNSKRMQNSLDIQRDHVRLIFEVMRLLADDGQLIFVTNQRRFRLDKKALQDLDVVETSAQTVPRDFSRKPRVHSSFVIRHARDNKED